MALFSWVGWLADWVIMAQGCVLGFMLCGLLSGLLSGWLDQWFRYVDGWNTGFAEWMIGSTVSLSGWLDQRFRQVDCWINGFAV